MADPKGLLILAVQDKMRNNGWESKPEQCTWQKAHFFNREDD